MAQAQSHELFRRAEDLNKTANAAIDTLDALHKNLVVQLKNHDGISALSVKVIDIADYARRFAAVAEELQKAADSAQRWAELAQRV